ncbi:MAG: glycoside hydrolase family 3 protein [Treponema sp.]|nr:glycoside hydrolase family 3 protein [Treponema sp.]
MAYNFPKITLCAILMFSSFTVFSLDFNDTGSPKELAAAIEMAMTDEQALAQVFMLGWVGAEPSPLILDWIRQRNIGGVKIFGWNTADTQRLARTVGELQEISLAGAFRIPLLIATDQEGGWIRHVKGSTSETPGNMAIGASGYPRDAYLSGYYIGKELALIGINMNFAPTVDLFTNRDSELIGPRAFGSDPVRAGILGSAFAKGQLAAGVIPTAKHYPGHGGTDLDSHGTLPEINEPINIIWDRELIPYRMLTAEGLPAIMSGHIAFPMTEAERTPASLSSWFLKDMLRGKIGFNGVVITDDLMMIGAISHLGSLHQTAKQALIAGNDIILLSSTPYLNDQVWTLLIESMRTEEGFRRVVRSSARRILELKLQYLRGSNSIPYVPDLKKVETDLPDSEGSAFFLNLAARSVTILKPTQAGSVFPIKREEAGRVLLAGRYNDFFTYGNIAFPGADVYRYTYTNRLNINDIVTRANNADTIIFCLSDTFDLRLLNNLEQLGKKVIVLSVLSPVHVENVPWVTGAVAVYSYAPESFASGFSAILGKIPAEGTLPYEW